MMYEAKLKDSSTGADSASRKTLLFWYYIFVDCRDQHGVTELVNAQEVVDGTYQIDGKPSTQLTLSLTSVAFKTTFSKNDACPITLRLESDFMKKADLDNGVTSSDFTVSQDLANPKVTFKATSNTKV